MKLRHQSGSSSPCILQPKCHPCSTLQLTMQCRAMKTIQRLATAALYLQPLLATSMTHDAACLCTPDCTCSMDIRQGT